METLLIVYVMCGVAIAWPLLALMFFREEQGRFPHIASRDRREDAGFAIAIGACYALIWPIGLPLGWCLTGFAYFGIVRQRHRKAEGTV